MSGGAGSGPRSRELCLPLSRVKTIMKSSPDVESVRQEPLVLVARVTELFIADMAKRAYEDCSSQLLEYKHIANLVQKDDTLDFLREIMPCKITVKEFKDLMAQKALKQSEDNSEDSDSSDDDDDDDDDEPEEVEDEQEDESTKDESTQSS
ncbi:chromatin accessibility complex protein 1 [Arctopsyche grandis]|uniref:chromatin accessibility complex protein 1 n=1 Tax=Arctopsyche grandis TaxID=121162 RepID=UPI00406D71E5